MAVGFDTRKLMTGKDGRLYISVNGEDIWYASVEEFEINMNFTNTDYQPAGSIQQFAVPTSVKFTLTFTEALVRDDLVLVPVLEKIKNGKPPVFDFSGGVVDPVTGKEQKIVCKQCVPDGDNNLLSVKPGEIVKRQNSFVINSVPDCLHTLI